MGTLSHNGDRDVGDSKLVPVANVKRKWISTKWPKPSTTSRSLFWTSLEINEHFKFVDTDEDDIIMTGKQIDFMESEGLDTTGMRRFNNESISRGVANTHVFQETLKTRANSFRAHCQKIQKYPKYQNVP